MSKFWDQRLHARLVKEAAERNGLQVKIRLGFVMELRHDGRDVLEVTFAEMSGQVTRILDKQFPDSHWVAIEPPSGLRSITTPRDRVDNLVRYIDEGRPRASFEWKISIPKIMRDFNAAFAPEASLAPLEVLDPVIDIKLRSTRGE